MLHLIAPSRGRALWVRRGVAGLAAEISDLPPSAPLSDNLTLPMAQLMPPVTEAEATQIAPGLPDQ